jgi:hypothetical protein
MLWSPVLLCVGQRPFVGISTTEPQSSGPVQNASGAQTTLFQLYYLGSQNVALADVMTGGGIKDAQNPSDRSHAVNYAMPYLKVMEDFALVSRAWTR